MAKVMAPLVEIIYNGRNITADLAPYLMKFEFTDKLDGEADSLDIELGERHHSLSPWLGPWYPDKGMELSASFGYAPGPLHLAGTFEVDEIEAGAPPLRVRIRALATGISKNARTRQAKAYEDTTLADVAGQVAKRMGAKVKGKIENLKLDRVTQYQESDWGFVVRLLGDYGYKARLTDNNKTLAVARLADLAQGCLRTLMPGDLSSWSYKDKITDVPEKSEVTHHNTKTAKLVTAEVQSGQVIAKGSKTAKDSNKQIVRAKTPEQAKAKAKAKQEKEEEEKTSLDCTLPGDPSLIAGAAVDIIGLMKLDGRYIIKESRHSIDVGAGYVTALSMRRLQES